MCYLCATNTKVTMLPTVNVVYNRKKKREIELSVYFNKRRRYFATGLRLPQGARYNNGVVSCCLTAKSLTERIHQMVGDLQDQLTVQMNDGVVDLSSLHLGVQGKTTATASFIEYGTCKVAARKELAAGTRVNYNAALSNLRSGGIEAFADMTAQKCAAFIERYRVGRQELTVKANIILMRAVAGWAVEDGLLAQNPFDNVKFKVKHKNERCYLTEEELRRIEDCMPSNPNALFARDIFLFACYTGLAYSDIIKIKKKDVLYEEGKPYIIDHRQKTGTTYRLRLLPKAMEILERYGYNLGRISLCAINARLHGNTDCRGIAEEAGVDKHITMHVGRHTFATLALSKGVRIETVSRMLAHTNITTTQIYAKILQKDVDKGFDILEDAL